MPALILKGCAVTPAGQTVDVLWSARTLGDGQALWWQLRYVLDSACIGKRQYAHLVIRDNLSSVWEPVWSRCGVSSETAFVSSLRSVAAGGGDIASNNVADEHMLSTIGLLIVLLAWGAGRRKAIDRQQAIVCLEVMLFKLLSAEEAMVSRAAADDERAYALCANREERAELCSCLGAAFEGWGAGRAPQASLATLLVGLMRSAFCDAATALLRKLLRRVAATAEGAADERLGNGALELRDACRTPAHKRRRMDPDLREALVSTGVRRGLAQTPAQIARAREISAESSVRTAVATTLASYRAEMHLRMRDAPHLSIAFDGKRLGKPAKETIVIAAWQGDHQEGMWLP